jgi:predicted CXXCH cytochrome family protein
MEVKRKFMILLLISINIILIFVNGVDAATYDTKNSVHNLSASGPGDIKSGEKDNYCLYCHTPHDADPVKPLWNHTLSGEVYTIYDSSTTDATNITQPDGTSKLCLSCHDGTVAIGNVINVRSVGNELIEDGASNKLDTSDTFADNAVANLGNNISNDHPISFVYDVTLAEKDIELKDPSLAPSGFGDTIEVDMLEENSKLQCASCHDPHDNSNGDFLIKANDNGTYGSLLCITCHDKRDSIGNDWEKSIHRNSTETNYTNPEGEIKSVALWGCSACHDAHNSSNASRLKMKIEEDDCYECHNSDPNGVPPIAHEFSKSWTHPTPDSRGIHDPAESYKAGDQDQTTRHAECADCHNAHTAQTETSHKAAPALPASLIGVDGLGVSFSGVWGNLNFNYKKNIDEEYELCLKCHSSYNYADNPPTSPSRVALEGTSAAPQTPIAKQFNPNNVSLHAVIEPHPDAGSGRSGAFVGIDRDGLPWGWDSQLLCTDCHGNEDPNDPVQGLHGSNFYFILKSPWTRESFQGEYGHYDRTGDIGTSDHLCFDCHDWDVYTANETAGSETGFSTGGSKNLHATLGSNGCSACHSMVPHGFEPQYPDSPLDGKAMLVEMEEPSPYSDGSYLIVSNWSTSGNWRARDCNESLCHQNKGN